MTDRILDFSARPASLTIRNGLLLIRQDGLEVEGIPCGEIAAVVLSHREITFTQAVLSELADAGAVVVSCDDCQRPAAMLLPLRSHHIQAGRFRAQADMPQPTRKRLWQQIVRAKIAAQAGVLQEFVGTDGGLTALVGRVRSGDPGNVEARAARRYWSLLFTGERFVRRDEGDIRNRCLNYGYAVLRSTVARAICACGLHPTFGLAHTNKANAFALADDLMEPFRPIVDRAVASTDITRLDSDAKRALIGAITARYLVEDESRTLFDILARASQSLARVVMGEGAALWLPEWAPDSVAAAPRKPLGRAMPRSKAEDLFAKA